MTYLLVSDDFILFYFSSSTFAGTGEQLVMLSTI